MREEPLFYIAAMGLGTMTVVLSILLVFGS